MNREAFILIMTKLLTELKEDHEEHTGITSNEEMSFIQWMDELNNLYENTHP